MSDKAKKHLVVIDGLSFLFRAFHAVRPLNRASDGLPTNALFGFAQMLIRVVRDLQPDLCCVALDSRGPTFRDDMYTLYKANRGEMDADMVKQMPLFEPMIEAFGIQGIRVEGVEADDIIATLVRRFEHEYTITIVSSDKDLMQLLGDNVVMLDTMKNVTHGPEAAVEKFGVAPDKVIEVQALIGDSSDNIPGVKGIGPKTAAQLIGRFGSLEGLYAHLEQVDKPRLKESLANERDNAFLSYKLVRLKDDVDLGRLQLNYTPTPQAAHDFLQTLDFKTLATRVLNGAATTASQPAARPMAGDGVETAYETVSTPQQLESWVKAIKSAGTVAVDTETTSLDPLLATLVGISLAVAPGKACYIPVGHKGDMLSTPQQLPKAEVLDALKPLLADKTITKIGHNLKYDWRILGHEGVIINGYEDTMLMSFCLYGGLHNHGLDDLCKRYLGHANIPYSAVCGTGAKQITFDQVAIDAATPYAAEDADMTLRLYHLFKPLLEGAPGPGKVYEAIERPLMPVVATMEERGVKVSREVLAGLSADFAARMESVQKKVYEKAGTTFNLNSPKQLGEVLFDRLNIPGGRRTKTGWSTDEEALTNIAEQGHDIATELLAWRSLAKLKSTYSDALQSQINPTTGRVHTSYHQAGAATGRFSSSDPNLQNIPTRSEDGRKIRGAFIAQNGYTLVSADYSQIELRLLAHMGKVKGLIEAFRHGADIHRHTASQIFDVAPDDVQPDQRRAAKIINFGIVYGMGPFALAKQLDIPQATAKAYIENYFSRYDGIRTYLDSTIEFAKERGYVETLYGRRVHILNIEAKNRGLVAGAERAAINAPLQGTNADIIKLAMCQLEDHFAGNDNVRMLMQVHDELIFEVKTSHLDQAQGDITRMMEGIVKLDVPLVVGIGHGATWGDAH